MRFEIQQTQKVTCTKFQRANFSRFQIRQFFPPCSTDQKFSPPPEVFHRAPGGAKKFHCSWNWVTSGSCRKNQNNLHGIGKRKSRQTKHRKKRLYRNIVLKV